MVNSGVARRVKAFAPLVFDVVAPIALYYVLRLAGCGEITAFAVSGLATGITAAVVSLRKRKLDTVKVLVFLELAVSLGLAIAIDDPRIAAIRPSIYLLIAGAYFLFSCIGVPVLYVMATPMATNGGEPVRSRAYAWAWANSGEFRRRQRLMTGSIGAVMFLDSVVRVIIVYSYPPDAVDRSFLYSNAAGVVMIVLVVLLMIYFVRRGGRYLDSVVEWMAPESSATAAR